MREYKKTVNLKSFKKAAEIPKEDEMRHIERPEKPVVSQSMKKGLIWVGILIALLVVGYLLFFSADSGKNNKDGNGGYSKVLGDSGWYSVRLVDGDIYYGQIENLSADPIVIKNTYYDYDQQKGIANGSDSLRLVKRGKETHGPSGEMNIIRSQVKYIEELAKDSKVLKAILEYEK